MLSLVHSYLTVHFFFFFFCDWSQKIRAGTPAMPLLYRGKHGLKAIPFILDQRIREILGCFFVLGRISHEKQHLCGS